MTRKNHRSSSSTDSENPREITRQAAQDYYHSEQKPIARERTALHFLFGSAWVAAGTPILFYLKFGEVGPIGWGFTIFLVMLCLLCSVGFYFLDKPQYHTPVAAKGGWTDRIGAFWLVACAFGPLFGWLFTASAFPVTEHDWLWRYAMRVILSVGLPILTALTLTRFVRGKGWLIMALLLVGVTALPVWSGAGALLDLFEGPVIQDASLTEGRARLTMLRHTNRVIKIEPYPPDQKRN